MAATFEIRAHTPTVDRIQIERVGDPFPEYANRTARMRFDELVREYPQFYFELVKVEHFEECLDYEPKLKT